jgi:hypothetical protein
MPILIWIATVACMMEMAGVLPSAPRPSDLDRSKKAPKPS